MNKNVKSLVSIIVAANCFVSSLSMITFADFVTEGKNTKYLDSNGNYVTSKLISIDNKTYYFDKNGNMKIGFFNSKNGTYYFDENGVMQTGLKKIDGTYYHFSEKGIMSTGTVVINNKNIYKFGSDGKFKNKADGWVKFKSGSTYYCIKGKIQKGIVTIAGNNGIKGLYFFDDNGKLVTGKNVEYKLSTLYIGSDGEIYDIEDNTSEKRNELNSLINQKKQYQDHIKECEKTIKDLKNSQSDVKYELDYYKNMLNNAKNSGSRMVYRADGSIGYSSDPTEVAYYQYYVDSYQEMYDEYSEYIKKCQDLTKEDKSAIDKIDNQIAQLKKEFKEAGVDV